METYMYSDPFDPYAQGNTLRPSEQQRLDEAKQLNEEGKPGQAAPLFARIAEVLTTNKQHQRAANLHALAAQAFAEVRNETAALSQVRAALNIFLQLKMVERAQFIYTCIRKEMSKQGMNTAVETLAKEFAGRVSQSAAPAAVRLPTNCPQCGAPVRVNEVHGIDVNKVECTYCGTPIRPLA
jgi:hypothetical protein